MIEPLKAATFRVLEIMFFLFPEPLEENQDLLQGEGLRAWVNLKGPQGHRVGLTVPLSLARKMAGNFLGVPEDQISPEKLEDVLQETANMMAGDFVTRLPGSENFHIQPPQAGRLNLSGENWRPQPHRLLFEVDGEGMEIFWEESP